MVLILGIFQLGSAIVIVPVIMWIWIAKDFTVATPATIYLVVSIADNALKRFLMGRGLTTPTPVLLIGMLGGTLAHAIVGLFVGPIILSVAWELMMAWIRDERSDPTSPETEPDTKS